MKKIIFLLFFPFYLFSQNSNQLIDNEIILSLVEGYLIEDILNTAFNKNTTLTFEYKEISNRRKIFLINLKNKATISEILLKEFQNLVGVKYAQFNYYVDFRNTIPDDSDFDLQWGLRRIKMPEVWDITTGGVTATGDTIVIAILERGVDIEHEDLNENIWYNTSEIPLDNVDNDQNGYIDDMHGWNFIDDKNEFVPHTHGLGVSGIVGAVGNNSKGVSGINWNIKLMILSVARVDEIFAAYEYVIDMRKRYNESGGTEGAFIVATNASFGIDREPCIGQPMWNDLYNQLGEVGVLTAAGTANQNYNVDEVGDIPTSCQSDFLITTLNITEQDQRHQGSAFGKNSIDLGAPGQNSFSLGLNNTYIPFNGNSAAAPHITGAIGLLYSLPCNNLAINATSQPSETALLIKDIILKGTEPLDNITGQTLTGGVLNVYGSLEHLQHLCGITNGPLKINLLYPNPAIDWLTFEYETPDFEPYRFRIFNALGQSVYEETLIPIRFLIKKHRINISNLAAGIYFITLNNGHQRASLKWVKI